MGGSISNLFRAYKSDSLRYPILLKEYLQRVDNWNEFYRVA